MSWKGRYYYRTRKIRGRVVREYFGAGPAAELAAQEDQRRRRQREAERAAWQAEKETLAELERAVSRLDEQVDLLATAALLAAGYHRPKRGPWRRKRVK
jgi:hypothetical protein